MSVYDLKLINLFQQTIGRGGNFIMLQILKVSLSLALYSVTFFVKK